MSRAIQLSGERFNGGASSSQTYEFSLRNAEDSVPTDDVHATLLRVMGLGQRRLGYLHASRLKKLTDIGV